MEGDIGTWLNTAATGAALVAIIVGGLWAYTKFILERALVPGVEFTLDCKFVGVQADMRIIEVILYLHNIGANTLVAKDVSVRLRYLNANESIDLLGGSQMARISFPHALRAPIPANLESLMKIVPVSTFVSAGVRQAYTLITAVPVSASFLLVHGRFTYGRRPSFVQKIVLGMSSVLGLTYLRLRNLSEPHTAERVFALEPQAG